MLTPEQRRAKELIATIRELTARQEALHQDFQRLLRLTEERNEQQAAANRDTQAAADEPYNVPIPAQAELQANRAEQERGKGGSKQTGPHPWLSFAVQALLCMFTAGAFCAALWYANIADQQRLSSDMQIGTLLHQVHVAEFANELARQGSVSSEQQGQDVLEQMKTALHVTERAYILAEAPELIFATRTAKMTFHNIGHIPSGRLEIITHEATINLESSNQRPDIKKAAEWHWSQGIEQSLPPGPGITINVPVPLVSETKIQQGLQIVVIVGKFRYQDGFPDDRVQIRMFCFQTLLLTSERRVVWRGRDPVAILHKLEALDGYPQNGQYE